jgi:hypothetical protein
MISQKLRLEGYAGQHLVVVPKPVRDEALRHPLLRSLLGGETGSSFVGMLPK